MPNIWRAALASVLLATPSAADAQPMNPRMYCVPGTPYACFGFAFESGEFWVQNLQGSVNRNPTPWAFESFAIYRKRQSLEEAMRWTPASEGLIGNVIATGAPQGMYESHVHPDDDPTNSLDQGWFYWSSENQSDPTAGLFGCSAPALFPDDYMGQTCPRRGYDGWWRQQTDASLVTSYRHSPDIVTFTQRPITSDDIVVEINFTGGNAGCSIFGASSGYRPGSAKSVCVARPYRDITPVPEPGTLALLGGGLGVMGLLGWRRQRT